MPVSTERKIAVNAGYSGWYEIELHSDQYSPAGYAGLIKASVNGMQNIFSKEGQHAV